jgi:aminoglycoside 3-N-acetyltransferase
LVRGNRNKAVAVTTTDYTREQMADALRASGVREGDVVFSHSNVGYFGIPDGGISRANLFDTIFGAFTDALGPEGTLVVPTFTYSFPRGELFDLDSTPSTCGVFTEMVRNLPEARRSEDPIFSVAAVGAHAAALTEGVAVECFGPDSFWDRFLEHDGLICNLNFDAGSTFLHFVEKHLDVPYRYDKLFVGDLRTGTETRRAAAVYFVHDLSNPDSEPSFEAFDRLARERGIVNTENLGRGSVVALRGADVHALLEEALVDQPGLLLVGDPGARIATDRPSLPTFNALPGFLWGLERAAVSPGAELALAAIGSTTPITVQTHPTGIRVGGMIVPERWTAGQVELLTGDGDVLASKSTGNLRPADYSTSVDAELSASELRKRLNATTVAPDALLQQTTIYENRWRLSVSSGVLDSLNDAPHRVRIESTTSFGAINPGLIDIPGRSSDSILISAHLGHQHETDHGLSGVLAAIELADARSAIAERSLSTTILLTPAAVGLHAFLEQASEPPRMTFVLDQLGSEHPLRIGLHHGQGHPDAASLHSAVRVLGEVVFVENCAHSLMCDDIPVLPLTKQMTGVVACVSRRPVGPDAEALPYHVTDPEPTTAQLASISAATVAIKQLLDALEFGDR